MAQDALPKWPRANFDHVREAADQAFCDDSIHVEWAEIKQDDTDADDCGNLCDADYDNSGTVGFADFGFFTSCFGTTNALCDHTEPVGGGAAGFADFGFFTSHFGTNPGPSGPTAGTTACP